MRIQTKFHGEIELDSNQIWEFSKGLPGFEEEKQFTLLPIEDNPVFQVLQSTTEADIAFVVASPYVFVKDYSFTVDNPTIEQLQIEKEEDVFVLGVISIKEPFETSTINLQAPLLFQHNTKKARQMILNENTFSMRHLIGSLEEVK